MDTYMQPLYFAYFTGMLGGVAASAIAIYTYLIITHQIISVVPKFKGTES